jgi:hypothetical protein
MRVGCLELVMLKPPTNRSGGKSSLSVDAMALGGLRTRRSPDTALAAGAIARPAAESLPPAASPGLSNDPSKSSCAKRASNSCLKTRQTGVSLADSTATSQDCWRCDAVPTAVPFATSWTSTTLNELTAAIDLKGVPRIKSSAQTPSTTNFSSHNHGHEPQPEELSTSSANWATLACHLRWTPTSA